MPRTSHLSAVPASTSPKAPSHLSAAMKRWYASVVGEYALEPHHLRLLELACESYDRCEQARRTISREGPTFVDRFGQPRAHPATKVEHDSALRFGRLLRELDLDAEPPPDPRLPRLRRNRR